MLARLAIGMIRNSDGVGKCIGIAVRDLRTSGARWEGQGVEVLSIPLFPSIPVPTRASLKVW
jgi:hypothetical protein